MKEYEDGHETHGFNDDRVFVVNSVACVSQPFVNIAQDSL